MRGGIATTAAVVGFGLCAAACGGALAAPDQGDAAAESPTTTAPGFGRFLPTTDAPSGRSADDDPGDSTTTAPPSTVVVPTDPPVVTEPLATTTVQPTTVPSTDPRPPGALPAPPTYQPYTIRPGLTDIAALTGLPIEEAVAAAPVLAVKIDNVGSARPQWELDRADVIFEENVEGATRFLALFHSDVPAEVGPVRSARTTDIDLLAAMNRPVLGWSGGNPGVTAWIDAAAEAGLLEDVAAVRSNCYRRESSRRSPHNLVAKTSCVLDRGSAAGPAVHLWAIDEDWEPSTPTTSDASFEVGMDNLRAGWSWDPTSETYLRSQNGAADVTASGDRVAAANVVVIFATHVPSAIDARSPEAITVGSGAAVIHRGGVAIPATWSRATTYDPFEFTASDGSAIALQVGPTFVELARAG